MSAAIMKTLSTLRNGTTRAGKCLRFCKRNLANDSKPSEAGLKTTESAGTPYVSPTSKLGDVHKVGNIERYFLVWTKKFKSVQDVPAFVSRDTMEKSRNIMRIRTNISIMVLVLIGALMAAQSGKRAAGKGESVIKNNLEWHKKYNESKESK